MNGNSAFRFFSITIGYSPPPSVGDVSIQNQTRIDRQKRLRHRQSSNRTVVQSSLHPLCCHRVVDPRLQAHREPGQSAHAFAPHRIAFVRHCGRSDLLFAKRFFQFLAMLQDADVASGLVTSLGDSVQSGHDLRIRLSRIRLTGHRMIM